MTRSKRWAVAAFALALTASLVLLFAPLGTEVQAAAPRPNGSSGMAGEDATVRHPSLLEIQGWSVAVPLSAPVLIAGAGVLATRHGSRRSLVVIAFLLGAFVVLGALSIGVFYVPAAVAAVVASVKAGGS